MRSSARVSLPDPANRTSLGFLSHHNLGQPCVTRRAGLAVSEKFKSRTLLGRGVQELGIHILGPTLKNSCQKHFLIGRNHPLQHS